jgi:multidrug efflux pump
MIALFWVLLQKETAPYDDRAAINMQISAPEGASYEYTDNFVLKLSQMIEDSIPERRINLTVTAPGFSGSGAANTGFIRLRLFEKETRERSQSEITDYLSKVTKGYAEAKTFVVQQPTISVNRRGGLPVNYIIQAPNFESL